MTTNTTHATRLLQDTVLTSEHQMAIQKVVTDHFVLNQERLNSTEEVMDNKAAMANLRANKVALREIFMAGMAEALLVRAGEGAKPVTVLNYHPPRTLGDLTTRFKESQTAVDRALDANKKLTPDARDIAKRIYCEIREDALAVAYQQIMDKGRTGRAG